jgi:putative phosphoribosyl transferase
MSMQLRRSGTRFANRSAAGRELAEALGSYQARDNVIVYGLPRGGVPVAFEVATALRAPLDVLIVRKLGVPGHLELAMGAVAAGGVRVINDSVVRQLGISDDDLERITEQQRDELEERERRFRGDIEAPDPEGAVAIVIDDGIATGSTMRASIEALREMSPAEIVVAVPVASPDICEEFEQLANDVVCLATEQPLGAVGMWYEDFGQTTDQEVIDLLAKAREQLSVRRAK